jgi:uncharacterized protein YndB with AHSA1/START domain
MTENPAWLIVRFRTLSEYHTSTEIQRRIHLPADDKTTLRNSMSNDSVCVTRRIAASPEQVFKAWTDAALLQRWLAPHAEADARQGGRFRFEVSKPEGSHIVAGVYREFMPDRRLVMTWVYEGPMAPAEKMEALLTIDFRRDGQNTEVILRHDNLTNPTYRETIQKGAWTKALDELEKVLVDLASQGHKAHA